MNSKYQILLFYKYTNIEDPVELMNWQKELCKKYNLKSRIIVAKEGINGTLEGLTKDTEKYIEEMSADSRFSDIHWKKSEGNGDNFPKISVKVRDEIVSLGLGEEDFSPNQYTGKYIYADELHKLYESGEEFYIIDMRNDYEQIVGHFKDSILMPLANFRDLPEKLSEIEHLKDKKVVTFCTGGIRCEKASGFLVKNGFTDVYQLFGGIQTYMEEYPTGYFLGKLYVFDGRILWSPKGVEIEPISNCEICGKKSDLYVDCAYVHCKGHRHFISCPDCLDENGYAFCSEDCKSKAYADNKFFAKRHIVLMGGA